MTKEKSKQKNLRDQFVEDMSAMKIKEEYQYISVQLMKGMIR